MDRDQPTPNDSVTAHLDETTGSNTNSTPCSSISDESKTSIQSQRAVYPYQEPAAPRTLIDILDAQIAAYPEAKAIDNATTSLTYAELSQKISEKVDKLKAKGVVGGDRVGIRLSSGSLNLYISILAVLASGAAYVPVDVVDPDERAELV